MGQRTLVKHGIQNEKSDYRIHVCFQTSVAYLFPTESGKEAVKRENGEWKTATQPGVSYVTGKGMRVKCNAMSIPGLIEITIPDDLLNEVGCRRDESTSSKGRKASTVAKELFKRGIIQQFIPDELEDSKLEEDLNGIDFSSKVINYQVKCDYIGGRRDLGGTGYLFLQTEEINPFGRT